MRLLGDARAQLAESAPLPAGPSLAPADATRVAPNAAITQRLAEQRRKVQGATDRLARNNVAVERARLSEHVYFSDLKPPKPEPLGWHMLTPKELARKGITPKMLSDPKSGFKAAIYESSFERPPKTVIAYAGTENTADWTTNFQQGVGIETKQYDMAMDLAKKVTTSFPKGTVDITGHSLGGGLASAGVSVTGVKGYSFNAAGLHSATVGRSPYSIGTADMAARGQLIDAYHSTADPLTNLQSGMKNTLGGLGGTAVGWPIGPEALGIPHPLPPSAGWDHKWSEFGVQNPFATSKSMALEGHGVDPEMVDHIDAQKDEDAVILSQYTGTKP